MGICINKAAENDKNKYNSTPAKQSQGKSKSLSKKSSTVRNKTITESPTKPKIDSDTELYDNQDLTHGILVEDHNIEQMEDKRSGIRYSFNDFIKHRVLLD